MPHIYPYLRNEDILQCRVTCKKWKTTINTFVEDHSCYHPSIPYGDYRGDTGRESVYYPLVSKKLHQVRFNWIEELEKFCKDFPPAICKGNPILGRSVCLYARVDPTWMANALVFLSRYGQHIWYFTFQSEHPADQYIEYLNKFLEHLPYLKKLRVYSSWDPQNLELEQVEIRDQFRIRECPLLKILEINVRDIRIRYKLMNQFAQQVQRLELDQWEPIYSVKKEMSLDNLKELIINVDSNEILESLATVSCRRLRKLTVTLRYRGIDLRIFERVLKNLGKHLRVLKIVVSTIGSFQGGAQYRFSGLVLSKLDVLVLVNASELPARFLCCVQSIEHLYYETWLDNGIGAACMSKYFNKSDMYESTIWEVLPYLGRLTHLFMNPANVKKVYTRQNYELKEKSSQELILVSHSHMNCFKL